MCRVGYQAFNRGGKFRLRVLKSRAEKGMVGMHGVECSAVVKAAKDAQRKVGDKLRHNYIAPRKLYPFSLLMEQSRESFQDERGISGLIGNKCDVNVTIL